MVRLQRTYFFSSGSTFVHPAGDGWRQLIVFANPDGSVMTLSIAGGHSKTFSRSAWDALRPLDVEFDPAAIRDRLTYNTAEMTRQGIPYEAEPVERAVTLLSAMLAPPPRIRTRARPANLPTA